MIDPSELDAITIKLPSDLNRNTALLVARFAEALAEKLYEAEQKYGYSDGWKDPGWMDQCRVDLVAHVHKGDPRDVAAYCAFLWHHRERTSVPASDKDSKLKVWFGAMPESNGKANWTAILHKGRMHEGETIYRSEYHDQVRYHADRVRYLIGELDKYPYILDYDADMKWPPGWVHPCPPKTPVLAPLAATGSASASSCGCYRYEQDGVRHEHFCEQHRPRVTDDLPFDLGYVYAYLKAALLDVEPEGLTEPQAAYFFDWFRSLDTAGTMPRYSGWLWTHSKKGGEYRLLGEAKVQTDKPLTDAAEVVVYQGSDGRLWARATDEFRARFKRLRPDDLKGPAP